MNYINLRHRPLTRCEGLQEKFESKFKMQVDEIEGLDAGVSDEWLTLELFDKKTIQLNRRAAKASEFFKSWMETHPNGTLVEFKQPDLSLPIMTHVVKYLHHYQDQEPKLVEAPLKSEKFSDLTNAWNVEFVDMPIFELLYTMTAANFLKIPSLVNLTAAKFSSLIKTKGLAGMQELLELPPNDKILDGENEVRKKYPEYFAWLQPPQEDSKMD